MLDDFNMVHDIGLDNVSQWLHCYECEAYDTTTT